MKVHLREDTLYLGDNGRAFCGKIRCAGMNAYYTGRDISGQKVVSITGKEARDYHIKCESCGFVSASFTLIIPSDIS